MIDLAETKKKRFLYLSKLYDESNGSCTAAFDMDEVGVELGFDDNSIRNIVDYLIDEGLLAWFGMGGSITLTHLGLKEVEQAYENPTQSTEHFAPIVNYNIQITSSGHGSVINTGNDNTININNSSFKNEIVSKAKNIIETIKEDNSITDQVRAEVIKVFNELIQEVEKNAPSNTTLDKIFAYGGSIGSIGSLVVGLIQLLSK